MHRHALSDAQWERIKDMLPTNGHRGRQWKDHRRVIDGTLWILNTGAPWRDLPERFGAWKTVYERFRMWCRTGFWDRLLERLLAEANAAGGISWELFFIDGSVVRAHKAAAGAKKKERPGEPADHALGRSRGGFSTKIHLICDAKGRPIGAELSPGQDHETTRFASLVDSIEIRGARGRPRKRPDALAGDKAYSAGWTREFLRDRRIEPVIPTRKDEARDLRFDRERYRERNFVERCIGWLKEARRVATRYEKLAVHYLGMLTLGMIMQYL